MKKTQSHFQIKDNNKEVAEELGISEVGAKFIKNNALKKAQKILKDKGFKKTDFFGGD